MALWQLLASLKSENMLRLKRVSSRSTRIIYKGGNESVTVVDWVSYIVHLLQDPFAGVSEQYKQALGEEEQRLLTLFFSRSSADNFLLEMHEFLVLVLKKPDAPETYKPDWG